MVRRLRDFRAQLLAVALVALAIRLVAVLTWTRDLAPEGDQNVYWRQGQDLTEWFGFVYRNNFGERVPTAVHPPLYSAYLGVASFVSSSPGWLRFASAVLGTVTVVLVGLAGRRVAGATAGIVAAALAAVYPNLWVNDAQLQSEAMYALTIALVLLCSYRFRDEPSRLNAAALGLSIALAGLARAEALALFVLLAVPLVLWYGRRSAPDGADVPPVGDRFRSLAVVAVVGGVVLAPWVVRNLVTFERPALMSSGAGFVIEISNCDQTYGLAPPQDVNGNPLPGSDDDTMLGYWAVQCDRNSWPAGDETVVEAHKRQIGLDYMAAHRRQIPAVLAARVGRIWDLWRPGQSYDFNVFFERRGELPTRLGMVQYYAMLPFAVAGLVSSWRRRVTIIPFVAIAVSVTMTAAVSFGITRYRVSADVALCILAGAGVMAAVRWWRGVRRPGSVDADDRAPAHGVGAVAP